MTHLFYADPSLAVQGYYHFITSKGFREKNIVAISIFFPTTLICGNIQKLCCVPDKFTY